MTSSPVDVLLGAQEPLFSVVPPARSSAGMEAVELAASAGLLLDPWQTAVLEGALGEREDGRWAAFEVGLIVPRQNGKGAVLEALELACLFLFGAPDELILHSAHEFKTAAEAFRRVLTLIQGCDDLDRLVKRVRTSHGDEGIELLTGQRLRFVARSSGSGRGFSGDKIILDEAYNLPAKAIAALLPTMAARPNPQLWYTSSAPLPGSESDTLRRLCLRGRDVARGKREERRLAFFEWAAPTAETLNHQEWQAELDRVVGDPEALARANPSLGIRISAEFCESERIVMAPDDFARERCGVYPVASDAVDQVLDAVAWADCRDETSGPTDDVRIALDVSADRRWATFAVAAPARGGGKHIELADRLPGTAKAVERAVELTQAWGGPLFVAAKSPTASLIPDLVEAGVEVREVTTDEHARACADLFDEVLERRMHHLGDPILDAAVLGAERRYYGDAWLWSRRNSKVDICPLVAVTLAAWAVGQPSEEKVVSMW
ncbi:MAG: hypothetical protein WKF86_00090 [Acidimicrobiales bacterium]